MKIKIDYNELKSVFKEILIKHDFENEDADLCAEIFTENTLCGVLSHGINRFPAFIELIRKGKINPKAKPEKIFSFNSIERWNGNFAPGPLNAWKMTNRAVELAKEFGTGLIALKNTNHWMRAATYGWKAADEGFLFVCWTNTIPNMPPWGGLEPRAGNNPIVFALPRSNGNVVLDMALSQFSYGKLATLINEGKKLPVFGGYDENGNLTDDPQEIYKTQRALPIGFWKGSGLSLLLDLFATVLSGGNSTSDLSKFDDDYGMSQIFIAINPDVFISKNEIDLIADKIISYYKSSRRLSKEEILYPGERTLKTRNENLKNGIFVEEKNWEAVISLKN
ncbi:MAG: 3-dehydro-L-gulonate 2-dehydrogenase [Melioribacteraceae bacterium]